MRAALILAALAAALLGCRSTEVACRGRTAADYTPSAARYREMSEDERGTQTALFNDLARRCGWEP